MKTAVDFGVDSAVDVWVDFLRAKGVRDTRVNFPMDSLVDLVVDFRMDSDMDFWATRKDVIYYYEGPKKIHAKIHRKIHGRGFGGVPGPISTAKAEPLFSTPKFTAQSPAQPDGFSTARNPRGDRHGFPRLTAPEEASEGPWRNPRCRAHGFCTAESTAPYTRHDHDAVTTMRT